MSAETFDLQQHASGDGDHERAEVKSAQEQLLRELMPELRELAAHESWTEINPEKISALVQAIRASGIDSSGNKLIVTLDSLNQMVRWTPAQAANETDSPRVPGIEVAVEGEFRNFKKELARLQVS